MSLSFSATTKSAPNSSSGLGFGTTFSTTLPLTTPGPKQPPSAKNVQTPGLAAAKIHQTPSTAINTLKRPLSEALPAATPAASASSSKGILRPSASSRYGYTKKQRVGGGRGGGSSSSYVKKNYVSTNLNRGQYRSRVVPPVAAPSFITNAPRGGTNLLRGKNTTTTTTTTTAAAAAGAAAGASSSSSSSSSNSSSTNAYRTGTGSRTGAHPTTTTKWDATLRQLELTGVVLDGGRVQYVNILNGLDALEIVPSSDLILSSNQMTTSIAIQVPKWNDVLSTNNNDVIDMQVECVKRLALLFVSFRPDVIDHTCLYAVKINDALMQLQSMSFEM